MTSLHRRDLLKGSVAAASAAVLPAHAWGRVPGSNEDIRVACVGIRGRGRNHMSGFQALEGVRVVALCDVDSKVLGEQAAAFEEKHHKVATYTDLRKLLEADDVDAVAIASPNHWHSLQSIWSCQAGKDVYCEKPISHNVFEGRKAVEAAERYDRIVATGTQSRSARGIRDAVAFVHAGKLGKVRVARGLCYKRRKSIGKVDRPTPVPDHVDFDLWTGPAPLEDLQRANLHYDWHWVWPTGNGDIGNQGIHQMDIARWALGATTLSRRVVSIGGRFGYDDDGQTPNTQVAVHEFDEGLLIFEVRGLETGPYKGVKIGNVIECEQGYVALDTRGGAAFDWDDQPVAKFEGGGNHYANFIEAVRARDPKLLRSDILEGHLSSALCHMGNVSHLLGKPASQGTTFQNDRKVAAEAVGRYLGHLAEQGLEDPDSSMGPLLTMDPTEERFVDDPAANVLLSRDYREPFVVRDEV